MIGIMFAAVDFESDKDKVAFIYKKYYKLIFHIVTKMVSNEDDVPDLVQEIMLRIIKNIGYIDLDNETKSKYLFSTIARNVCIDHNKAQKDSDKSEEYDPDETVDSAESFVMDSYSYEEIREALECLSDKYREVCVLKYVYGYKEREISEMLGMTTGLVNQRIFRGKQVLKKLVKDIMERRGL